MPRLAGLIAATFTPMHDDGRLRLELVPEIVDRLVARGVAGLYVCGSTGEGPLLTGAERRAVAEAYVRAADGRLPVVVQVGHTSVAEARELAAHAQASGADAVSSTPPTYFKPATLEDVVASMAEVAAGAPELPFFYYHIPPITGVQVDVADLMAAGEGRVPNLAGVKFSSPQVHEFAPIDRERFDVLFGVDEMLLAGMIAGARGAVGSTYNLFPEAYLAALAALERGDVEEARARQRVVALLIRRLVRVRPIPSLKAAMAFTGLPLGPTRLPLRPLVGADLDALRADLDAEGWLGAFTGAALPAA
ncbi:MAG: dihydrodipicolinate synthase family protein [Trueperaceae bacterium]